jgi:hypothetical protein
LAADVEHSLVVTDERCPFGGPLDGDDVDAERPVAPAVGAGEVVSHGGELAPLFLRDAGFGGGVGAGVGAFDTPCRDHHDDARGPVGGEAEDVGFTEADADVARQDAEAFAAEEACGGAFAAVADLVTA